MPTVNVDYSKVDISKLEKDQSPRESKLRESWSTTKDTPAPQAAHISKLASDTANPVSLVKTETKKIENDKRFQDIDKALSNAPKTQQWFSNPENMAQAKDDAERLGWFEGIFKNLGKSMGESLKQSTTGVAMGSLDATADSIDDFVPMGALPMQAMPASMAPIMSLELTSNIGVESDEDLAEAKDEAKTQLVMDYMQSEEAIKQMTPQDLSIVQKGIRGGFQSLVMQAPGFAASLLTKSPGPMLSMMTSQVGSESYAKARAAGKSVDQAILFSGTQAAIEFATEKIPATAMVKMMGPGWKKELSRFAAGEILGEQVATIAQSINEYAHGLDDEMAKAKTLEDVARIQAERQAVTLISTIVSGGTQAGVVSGIGAIAEKRAASETDQARLDEIAENAGKVSLKSMNPEAMRDVIRQQSDGQVVYLDPIAATEYFQGDNVTEEDLQKDSVKLIVDDIPKALDEGRDIEIPMSAYTTDIAGTSMDDSLRSSMRINPTIPTPDDINNHNLEQEFQDALNESEEVRSSEQEVFDDVKQQLTEVGFRPEIADQNAFVIEAFFRTQSQRVGVTPKELYDNYGLQIQNETQEIIKGGNVFSQLESQIESAREGQDNEMSTILENAGIDIAQANEDIISQLGDTSGNEIFFRRQEPEEVTISDPLEGGDQSWRDTDVQATLEDGTTETVKAGVAFDAINARKKSAQQILDCIRAS